MVFKKDTDIKDILQLITVVAVTVSSFWGVKVDVAKMEVQMTQMNKRDDERFDQLMSRIDSIAYRLDAEKGRLGRKCDGNLEEEKDFVLKSKEEKVTHDYTN